MQVSRLRRMTFGRSSEKLTHQADQLELGLEEREAEAATATMPTATRTRDAAKPCRQPLPDHLPRTDVVHEGPCVCPDCGGAMRRMGEDVTEQLDYVPASFRVVRHVRPRLSCRSCERIVQAPLPSMPIERGRPRCRAARKCAGIQIRRPSAALPAVGHLRAPERRPCPVHARRSGRALGHAPRSAGRRTRAPRHGRRDPPRRRYAGAGAGPGAGRTRTGRLWTYVRDERGAGGEAPPAVLFRYAPDRKGERPAGHLAGFQGDLHADGYAGFDRLYGNRIREVAC